MNYKFPHLFEPILLGKTLYKNRIFYAPSGHRLQSSDDPASYYERKAIGGAASVCMGDAVVSGSGIARPNQPRLDLRSTVEPLEQIASAIARHGSVPAIEIMHAGYFNGYSVNEFGHKPYGPVHAVTDDGVEIFEMTEEMILQNIEDYANAAARAQLSGFGRIVLHAAHGWQITQFFSPFINKRSDRWGGASAENRARFAVAICDRIRQKCPGITLEVRIAGSECWDQGYDIGEGVEISKQLDGHCDLIHVSAGNHEVPLVNTTVMVPSMFETDGVNVKYAAEIRKHVKTPVATVGALADPAFMEEIIASGKADVVEVARGLIADPDIPLKSMFGKEDEIRLCLRCSYCYNHHKDPNNYRCAINPEIGNEHEIKHERPPKVIKKVLVAGGGVSGMQAAITCAERGHKVILCEKTEKLGGVLRCEEFVPFKTKLIKYLDHQAYMLSKTNADIRLSTVVTPELCNENSPDVIIAAIGSRPVIPDYIKGLDRPNVFGVEEAYTTPGKAGKRVVIIGGGLAGLEYAVFMGMNGHEVTLIEILSELNDGGNNAQGMAISGEIEKYGIRVSVSTKVVEINEKGVVGEFTGELPSYDPLRHRMRMPPYRPLGASGTMLFEADTVVYAVGQEPLMDEALALQACAPEFYQIGDCLAPRNIYHATHPAYFIARDIGMKY